MLIELSGKAPYREMRDFAGGEKQHRNLELQALQSSSLHPRSRWGQYAAVPDMRISLLIWSSDKDKTVIILVIIMKMITR